MQIHVVKPGESITTIARSYGSTVTEIVEANQIPNPNRLVVGQTMVIPIIGSFYEVQKGDSLWSIANRFGLTYQELARINGISVNQSLTIGFRLYIPEPPKVKMEFNAYLEPFSKTIPQDLQDSAKEAAPYLTYLAPFSFQALRTGELKEPALTNLKQIADDNNNILMMVITNLEDGGFNDELGRILLNDQAVQNKLLNNIETTAKKYGFRDIHFDFEYLRPADKEAYNQFLRKAKQRFSAQGWLLSTALAPKTSSDQKGAWYEAHDYKTHGEIVDFVVIMTYEWGYSGGPAQAVSPIGPVREVLEYAITEMPSKKIMMGQNLYGYDWTLPFKQGTTAKALSPQAAIVLAADNNVPIEYNEKAQAPTYKYRDQEGKQHEVWFEDARSIQAKFNLMRELNLRGMSYWKLGLPFPQNWLLIDSNFTVEKK